MYTFFSSLSLSGRETVTIGLGIFFALVWGRRTGFSCGGLITPGLLALHAGRPEQCIFCLVAGLVLTPVLRFMARVMQLYGRERVGAAMLLAVFLRLLIILLLPSYRLSWVGWIIPGLIAADAERQGTLMTICSVVSCAIAVSFAIDLLRWLA